MNKILSNETYSYLFIPKKWKKEKKIISKFLMLFVNFEKIEKFKIVWKLKLQKIY